MKENILYPSKANHRVIEISSTNSSNESKAHISRWYAEMMIKEFLNDQFVDENYIKKSLSELIDILSKTVDPKIIHSLRLIKDFGDKASHYNPENIITDEQANKIVDEAMNLYILIILDELKKRNLYYHTDRATLISVLLPNMRVKIYSELIEFSSKEINLELLWKWCLACLKDNKISKARRKMQELAKNGLITKSTCLEFDLNLEKIKSAIDNDELPIPNNRADFVRNLSNLLNEHNISSESKLINARLINILQSMADQIEPSSMGHYKGMRNF
ncbi:hypothetical protein [Serratia proteamaculans]|uniref:hypothetical protein n=1 Tax=Serratia proteamaculans TaxID=28151 RepID=UPI0039B0F24D